MSSQLNIENASGWAFTVMLTSDTFLSFLFIRNFHRVCITFNLRVIEPRLWIHHPRRFDTSLHNGHANAELEQNILS